jgi:hypothetical protein
MNWFSWDDVNRKLDQLLADVQVLNRRMRYMAIDLSKITASVARENTVGDSVLTLVQGLVDQMTALSKQLADAIANSDPGAIAAVQAALDDLAAKADAESDKMAAAVSANTPAVPPPADTTAAGTGTP